MTPDGDQLEATQDTNHIFMLKHKRMAEDVVGLLAG